MSVLPISGPENEIYKVTDDKRKRSKTTKKDGQIQMLNKE
jgi:hypothetical protein